MKKNKNVKIIPDKQLDRIFNSKEDPVKKYASERKRNEINYEKYLKKYNKYAHTNSTRGARSKIKLVIKAFLIIIIFLIVSISIYTFFTGDTEIVNYLKSIINQY